MTDMPLDRAPLLLLSDVAELLNISASQVYALVRRGDLQAVRVTVRSLGPLGLAGRLCVDRWRQEHGAALCHSLGRCLVSPSEQRREETP